MEQSDRIKKCMIAALEEAFAGMRANDGGPFGAVIVTSGRIIARAHNMVIVSKDPTAHAEIVAIRMASQALGRFDLSDCEIFSSCEPCPMCFSAIHWARIGKTWFAGTRDDAARAGFDDRVLYDLLAGRITDAQTAVERICDHELPSPFDEWLSKEDRIPY